MGAASLLWLADDGAFHYAAGPRVEMPLPPPGVRSDAFEPGRAVLAAGTPAAPPAEVDPALSEPGPYGPLPRLGPDGRTPLQAYARRAPPADGRHEVALLVVGLGLRAEATEAALALPGPVSLVFSPYAPDLPQWLTRARRAGHEVLLGLPMEPAGYPDDDPGPHTLLAAAERESNLDRLAWVLAQGSGYVGVAGYGGRFAAAAEATAPVLAELKRRGLAVVELGDGRLAAAAAAIELPYVSTRPAIEPDAEALVIDFILAGLEAQALTGGTAVGVAEPYPVVLERLRLWIETLADKGITLTPLTALLGDHVNRTAERRSGVDSRNSPGG